jgi:hypothetical protein
MFMFQSFNETNRQRFRDEPRNSRVRNGLQKNARAYTLGWLVEWPEQISLKVWRFNRLKVSWSGKLTPFSVLGCQEHSL